MEQNKQQLYCLYVVQTGKVFYVGITKKKLSYRLREHLKDRESRSPKKSNKIRSERRKGNTIEIFGLLEFDTLDEVHAAERKYIAWCRTIGFELTNSTDGGEGTIGMIWTDEMRSRRSKENAFKGVGGLLHPTSLSVDQFDLNDRFLKQWVNQTEAAKELGIHKQGISKCCNGTLKQSGGFIWKYTSGTSRKNHPKSFKDVDIASVKDQLQQGKTITEVAKSLGIERHTLSRRLREN
jgi:DNA-binding protein Fis